MPSLKTKSQKLKPVKIKASKPGVKKPRVAKIKVSKPTASPVQEVDYQKSLEDLLGLLLVPSTVSFVKDSEFLRFEIQTENPAVLIGFHGETLSSLERLLGLMFEKKLGVWQKVVINVNDYRQRREETLRNLALSTAQRVKFSGQPASLPPLSPSERRIIHLILSEHPDVITESEGEDSARRVVVKPRPQV